MGSTRLARATLIIFVGALFLAPLSLAQNETASDTSASFSDEEVESVATAFVAIQQLRQQYQQQHGNPQDLDSAQVAEIRKEFQGETQQVIEGEGITRGTFGQVLQAAQSDSTLRNQLSSEIEEAGGQVPQGLSQQSAGGNVTQQQIQRAGQAFAQIQQLRQQYRTKFGSVQDSTRQQQIQQKYQQATQQAIQEAGLNPMQFSQVVRAAQSDANVRQQFFAAIEAAGGQPPQPAGGQSPPPAQGGQSPSPSPSPGPGN